MVYVCVCICLYHKNDKEELRMILLLDRKLNGFIYSICAK